MESQLFNDLQKSLKATIEALCPGDQAVKTLARTLSKHVNKKQGDILHETFPEVFGKRGGKLTVRTAKTVKLSVSPTTVHTVIVTDVGAHGSEPQADLAAQQFLLPGAVSYNSAVFPDPHDYGVKIDIPKADAIKKHDYVHKTDSAKVAPTLSNTMYPWTVRIRVNVTGERSEAWINAFKNKLRMQV
jgi:hypothetical protein